MSESQFPPTDTGANTSKRALPFAGWAPFLTGAIVGLALRLVFSGSPGRGFSAMGSGFILFAPVLVAAVTVFVAERRERRSWSYYAWAGSFANVLFVIGTMFALIEGLICAIVILPLFSVLGALGGLLMGAICRAGRWHSPALFGFAALPLVLAGLDPLVPEPQYWNTVERTRIVHAPAASIWRHLENARDIRDPEVGAAWMYRIGVPLPLEGVTENTAEGVVRHVRMGRNVHFDQLAAEWQPGVRVRWKYRFFEDSFPPGSLDDHVRIGGEYFDLDETTYALEPGVGDSTRLSISMRYRVSTQFNWYAKPIAEFLVGNFCDVILQFYATRAERAPEG